MYVCMVSSFGLLYSSTGAPSGGAGHGRGDYAESDARGFTDAEVMAFRTKFHSLTDLFMEQLKNAYFAHTGVTNPLLPHNRDGITTRIEKAYKLFTSGISERVARAKAGYNPDYPVESQLTGILDSLNGQYQVKLQGFKNGITDDVLRERLYGWALITDLTPAERAAHSNWRRVWIQPDFEISWKALLLEAENAANELAWECNDLANRRVLSQRAQAIAVDSVQPQLARDSTLANYHRVQHLADGEVTARLREEELRQRAAHEIHVQTAVGTTLENVKTEGARVLQDDNNAARAQRQANTIAAAKWLLVAGALSAVGGIGAYFGFKQLGNTRPKIIAPQDTSIGSLLKKARYPAANLDRLILTPELEVAVRQKFQGIERAIQKMLPLSNMMFFGPAGTGKTMAAQEFVRYLSGKKLVDHIIVRGPAFKQFNKTSEAISALKAIIRFAENSYKKHKRPVVIVFDEAETLFADRGQPEFSTEATRDLVTTMTSEISAAVNKHVMFILSTNFPQRIDQALLNRIDESNRIRFEAPGQKEREDLLRLYLDEALTQEGFTVSDEVMDAIPALAKSIDGMVGRQISSMVTQSIYRLLNEGEAELTLPIFQETIAATRARKDYAAY
jgi:hypothetical protein